MQAILFSPYSEERAALTTLLQQAGFIVRAVQRFDPDIQDWSERPADLFLLALPGSAGDYVSKIKQLRASAAAPIVLILENQMEDHQVACLEAGADLLLDRPFSLRVMLSQLRAILRRSANIPFFSLPTLTRGEIVLDPAARAVKIGSAKAQRLTQLEFRLLYTLMIHAGQIMPSENIVESVWGYDGPGSKELVRGLVQRLRSKIEKVPGQPQYILTEPGIGYFFNDG